MNIKNRREEKIMIAFLGFKIEITNPTIKGIIILILVLGFYVFFTTYFFGL